MAPQAMRAALRRPARMLRRVVLPRLLPPSRGVLPVSLSAVRVVGLLSSATGIGKSARLCAEALAADGIEISTADVSKAFAAADGIPYLAQGLAPALQPTLSVYHLNPPKLPIGVLCSGIRTYRRAFNVGFWAWELQILPPEWVAGLRFVDAVMVPSSFCRDAVARYTSKPVLVVPHPVHLDTPAADTFPTQDGTFRILSIFSFDSSFERKNPVALVRAFKQAFADDRGVELLLKSTGGSRYPEQLRQLLREIGGASNITLVDDLWSPDQLSAALASTQAYASLHRSEGFGLTLAEAALAHIPVVATNWSGNTDFCPPDLCYPVHYDLVPVRDDHPDLAGTTGAVWAEPSVEAAAAQLRAVRASPEVARRKAAALKASLVRYLQERTYGSALAELARSAVAVDPRQALARSAA